MFDMGSPAIVARSLLVLLAVVVGLRVAGKRELAQSSIVGGNHTVPGGTGASARPG
jgi:hypothetical protein